ncbi:MAG: magnesium transporter [Spirochaetae bacterium HGW-Spirochaetae-1]|jgi:magnesium transporter|nr:MAG: magnesium transporter [Spirochaetae bacterium HGW-Spirochaetae-1]
MKNPILIPELRDLLKKKKFKVLKSFMEESHPKESAEYLALMNPDEIWRLLKLVDIFHRVDIFVYLDIDVQVKLVTSSMRKNVTELLQELSSDKRADLFQHLEKDVADRLMLYLPIPDRADILKLTSYREETAGSIMTTDYATLTESDTVEAAVRKIRKTAPSRETIYYIYVIDDVGKLIGFVSLEKIILSQPRQKIKNIMKKDIIYAFTDDDQENTANLIEEYDLIALPIIDRSERLVGIITYDDAIDIIREEHTEDMEKLMAISGGVEEKPYLEVPSYVHFRKRAFWVVILAVFGLFTGLIIESFQDTLKTLLILTFYMPLLNAAGGNTGSQSATVVLRSLTLNELHPRDLVKVIKKEFLISSMLALCLGLMTFARVYLFSHTGIDPRFTLVDIAMVIAVALSLQVVWSTIFGGIIPIIATRLKVDPALVSSPLLATVVDMGGVIIYFTAAKLMLGI